MDIKVRLTIKGVEIELAVEELDELEREIRVLRSPRDVTVVPQPVFIYYVDWSYRPTPYCLPRLWC